MLILFWNSLLCSIPLSTVSSWRAEITLPTPLTPIECLVHNRYTTNICSYKPNMQSICSICESSLSQCVTVRVSYLLCQTQASPNSSPSLDLSLPRILHAWQACLLRASCSACGFYSLLDSEPVKSRYLSFSDSVPPPIQSLGRLLYTREL